MISFSIHLQYYSTVMNFIMKTGKVGGGGHLPPALPTPMNFRHRKVSLFLEGVLYLESPSSEVPSYNMYI